MKSRMMISLLVIAMTAAIIGGATMAWFTDEAEADPVTFEAGTLLIDIDDFNVEDATEDFVLDNLNPGDEPYEAEFTVVNEGSKDFIFKGYLCWEDIVGQLNENLDEDMREALEDRGYGDTGLSEVLELEITVRGQDEPFFEGIINENKPVEFGEAELSPGESLIYDVKVTFPEEAGNEFQGSMLKAAFTVMAKQVHEDAEYGEFVCPLEDEIALGTFYHYLGTVDVNGDEWGAVNQVEIFGVEDGTEVTVTMAGDNTYVMGGTVEDGIATVIADDIIAAGSYDITVEVNSEELEYKDDIHNYYPEDHDGELQH